MTALMERIIKEGSSKENEYGGGDMSLTVDGIEYKLVISDHLVQFTINARDTYGTSGEQAANDSLVMPTLTNTAYYWQNNDVFSTFYDDFHPNTSAQRWEHLGINGTDYSIPGQVETGWFDIYCVVFADPTTMILSTMCQFLNMRVIQ